MKPFKKTPQCVSLVLPEAFPSPKPPPPSPPSWGDQAYQPLRLARSLSPLALALKKEKLWKYRNKEERATPSFSLKIIRGELDIRRPILFDELKSSIQIEREKASLHHFPHYNVYRVPERRIFNFPASKSVRRSLGLKSSNRERQFRPLNHTSKCSSNVHFGKRTPTDAFLVESVSVSE